MSTKNSFEIIIISTILLLGVVLYFYKIESAPSGIYIDEAAPAYNAYSILKTGKDEYGKSFPVLFRSAGLYITPLYTYLTTVPVKFFGLTVFSARFVSILSGLGSGAIIYLFLKNSGVYKDKRSSHIGLILFLITPWIFFYSRFGAEISLGFFLFSLGAFLTWISLGNKRFLLTMFIVLSLSVYSAPFNKILAPLMIIVYLYLSKKELKQKLASKNLIYAVAAFVVIQIPNLLIANTPAFLTRSNLVGDLTIRNLLSRYVTYFSPRSLFFLPDSDIQRSLPELSVFYFWMIIPYFIGLYFLWTKRKEKFSRFLATLLVISPIPASLTSDPFSTHRAIPLLLPLFLVIMLGIDYLISEFHSKVWIPTLAILIFISLLFLWRSYFVLFANERAKIWGYGFDHLATHIKSNPDAHFLIDQGRMKPAYIHLAFYLKMNPEIIQNAVGQSIKDNYYNEMEFNPNYKLANFETRPIDWEKDIYQEQILVGDELAVSESQAKEHFLTKVFEIKDPLDFLVFQGYQTNPVEKCTKISYKNVNCSRWIKN